MLLILAQAAGTAANSASTAAATAAATAATATTGHQGPIRQAISQLAASDYAVAAAAFGAGLLLVLYGYRLYRIGLLLSGAALGLMAGVWIIKNAATLPDINPRYIVWGCGLVGMIMVLPLERLAVAFVGGSVGSVVCGGAALHMFRDNPQIAAVLAVAALIGFALFGWMATFLRRFVVTLATSAWGALLLIAVGMSVWNGEPLDVWNRARDMTVAAGEEIKAGRLDTALNPVAEAVWVTLTLIGLLAQYKLLPAPPEATDPEPVPADAQGAGKAVSAAQAQAANNPPAKR
jgi:hypothetical protein